MANTVQSIGSFNATIVHPLVNSGASMTIAGIKLDSSFFDSMPEMENSKRIALLGSGAGQADTAAITNNAQYGEITLNVVRVGTTVSTDLIKYALAMQLVPDSSGATIVITYNINKQVETWTFVACTLGKVPPMKLAGNDIPEYSVTFKYGSFTTGAVASGA